MSVSNEQAVREYFDPSVGVAIDVDIYLLSHEHLEVLYGDVGRVATYGTDYTVTLASDYESFTLTLLPAFTIKMSALLLEISTEKSKITVRRKHPYTSTLTKSTARYRDSVASATDQLAQQTGQLSEGLQRAIQLSPSDGSGGLNELPGPAIADRSIKRNSLNTGWDWTKYDPDEVGDALENVNALLAQALAAAEGSSAISVLTHGAKGDSETNDIAAFQAARDKAVELGLDRVVIPIPPDPDDYYFVVGDITGVADVEWIMDPRAVVNGSTNLFARQVYKKGCHWYDPPIEEVIIDPVDFGYTHQPKGGKDLDNEWIIAYQWNDTYNTEGSDQQQVGVKRSTDNGEGLTWTDRQDFTTDAALCTNPIDPLGETPGRLFRTWRTGVINFAQHGFGQKLGIRYGHTGGSVYGTNGMAFKTEAEGQYTLYYFYQLTDDTIRLIRYGDSVPSGALSIGWRMEGVQNIFPAMHDHLFLSSGRLCIYLVNSDRPGRIRRNVSCIYCDNPGDDPEDMVFRYGPSVDIGYTDAGDLWELSAFEMYKDFVMLVVRVNQRGAGSAFYDGDRHMVSFGNGVAQSGFRPIGIQIHRTRSTVVKLNQEIALWCAVDDLNTRGNAALFIYRNGAGITPAITMSRNDAPYVEQYRHVPENETDTLITVTNDAGNLVDFTDKVISVTRFPVGADRFELATTGYVEDIDDNSLDFGSILFEVGDTIEGESGRGYQRFEANASDTYTADIGLTGAFYLGILNRNIDTIKQTAAGGVNVDTGSQKFTLDVTGNNYQLIDVTVPGPTDSKIIGSPLDTIWNLSADASIDVASPEDGFFMRIINSTLTTDIERQDIIADTAQSLITLRDKYDIAVNRDMVAVRNDKLKHVPTVNRHPVTGDIMCVWGEDDNRLYPGVGAKGISAGIIRAENLPRTDKLNFIPRSNAFADTGNLNQTWEYDESTGIAALRGRCSAGADLAEGHRNVAVYQRLSDIPNSADPVILFVLGSVLDYLSAQAVFRGGYLFVDIYRMSKRSETDSDPARERIVRRELVKIQEDGSGGYTLDDDAWFTVPFRYSSADSTIEILGHRIELPWPYVFILGDAWLSSEAPTTQRLYIDVLRSMYDKVPDYHKDWGPVFRNAPPANLVRSPGLDYEHVNRRITRFDTGAGATFPDWQEEDDGGCVVEWRPVTNSFSASSSELDSWPYGFTVSITATGLTGEPTWSLIWPDIYALPPGAYTLHMLMRDNYDVLLDRAASNMGTLLEVRHFYDLGGIFPSRSYTPASTVRVRRFRERHEIELQVPSFNPGARPVHDDAYQGIEFRCEAGVSAILQVNMPQVSPGTGPVQWIKPRTKDTDLGRKSVYSARGKNVGDAITEPGVAISSGVARFGFSLPGMQSDEYDLIGDDGVKVEQRGTLYAGTPSLVGKPNSDRAVVDVAVTGTLSPNEPAHLVAGDKATTTFTSVGSNRLFRLDKNLMTVEAPDDITVKRVVGGSTSTDTLDTHYKVRATNGPEFDWLKPTSGSPNLFGDAVSPKLTGAELYEIDASGKEILRSFDTDWTASTGNDVTLIDAGGTATNALSSSDFFMNQNVAQRDADVIMRDTSGIDSIVVEHNTQSGAGYVFDARPKRHPWMYHSDVDALRSAFDNDPGRKRMRAINSLVVGLDTIGAWSKYDFFYVLLAHEPQAARLNWKDPGSFVLTDHNLPVYEDNRCVKTDGVSSYIQSAYTPADDGVNWLQDDANITFVCLSVDTSVGTGTLGGTSGSGAIAARLLPRDNSDNKATRMNGSVNDTKSSLMSSKTRGYFSLDRSSSAGYDYYAEGKRYDLRRSYISRTSSGTSDGAVRAGKFNADYGKAEVTVMAGGGSLSYAQHIGAARLIRAFHNQLGVNY